MDSIKLRLFKNKEEHAQSAIASQEVREHLAGFIRSKRQGSSTQINNIQQKPQQQQSGQPFNQSCSNGGGSNSFYIANLINADTQDDDHPLRKTASMPSMHIPYKAQTLSRRRQMERRTTMSPLTKRKTRPKKQLLHSMDSNSTEYSSNPCIIQSSGPNTRSLSQSSTPPPHNLVIGDSVSGGKQLATTRRQSSNPTPTSQSIKLSSIFTNSELDNLQNNLNDSLYFSTPHSSTTNVQQPQAPSAASSQKIEFTTGISAHNNSASTASNTIDAGAISGSQSSSSIDSNTLRQQQHLKVNEAIRKTVIQRASGKGRIGIGRSLDIEGSSATASKRGENGRYKRFEASAKDELRQWSFDGADLRTNTELNKLLSNAGGQALASSVLINKRLATTNDTTLLKRPQSPSSSISMGLPGCQISASMAQSQQSQGVFTIPSTPFSSQQYPPHLRDARVPLANTRIKQFSSSSSSTSSLLSQQDSLEESSSQAIDLSSSSEAGRQRQQKHHISAANLMFASGTSTRRSQLANHLIKGPKNPPNCPTASKHYQSILQESFNQLQLCQSQDGIKQLLLSQPSPSQAQQHQIGSSSEANDQQHQLHQGQHHPSLVDTSRTANSLELDAASHQGNLMTTPSEQFNVSASAQNLISLQDQQRPQGAVNNLGASLLGQHLSQGGANSSSTQPAVQQSNDLNQWQVGYNNTLLQSSELQQHQQPNQISSELWSKVASLPEPYKSSLLTHLIQQQQQIRTIGSATDDASVAEFGPQQLHLQQDDQRFQLKGRTLSSPLLISADMDTPMPPVDANLCNLVGCSVAGASSAGACQLPSEVSVLSQTGSEHHKTFDQTARMIVCASYEQTGNRQQLLEDKANEISKLAERNLSIDLSLPSRSSEETKSKSIVDPFKEVARANLNYTTIDPMRANCSFIYTPVFDEHSTTGITYELELCNHKCICANENNHPESSQRVLAIWRRLFEKGLMAKCARIESRQVSLEEVQLCHSETYSYYFGKSPYERIKLSLDLSKLPIKGLTQLECGGQGADIDTAWNEEHTPGAARLAVGCVVEAAVSVATGKLMNAFAIVRPPGHHAEHEQALGFCFFNSVAIAARVLITKHQLYRILIIDWDVHHGNGIQRMFYDDKNVMYISLHRYDKGNFFPGTGGIREFGQGQGEGFNWNIAWSNEVMGDAEYLAAFRSIVMPIARDYNPTIVLVACGFDAASGHPFNFGGYDLSPACFANMTRQLMTLANGRLVLCLEGGYQLNAICDCAESCIRALLNEPPVSPVDLVRDSELRRQPNSSAIEVLMKVSNLAMNYWRSVGRWRRTIELSAFEAASVK